MPKMDKLRPFSRFQPKIAQNARFRRPVLVKFFSFFLGLPAASLFGYFHPRTLNQVFTFTISKRQPKEQTMKKLLLALMVLACAATASMAADGVLIQWTSLWGAYTHDAPNVVDDPSDYFLLDSYSLTWQLIYSVDAVADDPDLANSANGWVSNDDTVWATRTFVMGDGSASDGTEWTTALYYQSGNTQYSDSGWTTAGYIFQRAYEGTPQAGSWYFDTTPEALSINPAVAQTSYIDADGGGFAGFQPDQQITAAPIPEPATMGLLGLGALVMAIRRRRS